MRLVRLYLVLSTACILALSLSGCGMSEEDKDYYLRGWVRPTDLDKPSPSELRRRNAAYDDPAIAPPSGPASAVGSSTSPGSY